MKSVQIYGKSREKRHRRRKAQSHTFTCNNCGKPLTWHLPRKEGVFCENCWTKLNKVGD